jgi:CheY-like chemotaxis protein
LNCFNDPDEGLQELLTNKYDSAIIDLRMPKTNGLQIIDACVENDIEADLCVLSSYLYLNEYKDRLNSYDRKIELLDKEFPAIGTSDFEEYFIAPLRLFINKGAKSMARTQLKKGLPSKIDNPFDVSYDEYKAMSIHEKDLLSDKAEEYAKEAIKESFKKGYTWVFFCGSATKAKEEAFQPKDRLSSQKMMEIAKTRNKAPFQFFAPTMIEEIKPTQKWSGCGEKNGLNNYPTLNLEFGDTMLKVHFDTGAYETYMSAEELIEAGVINPNEMAWSNSYILGDKVKSTNLNLRVFFRCPETDITRQVVLNGQLIRNWNNGPFMRACNKQSCVQLSPVIIKNGFCRLRVGLIGRNILTDNELVLVLDGIQKITRFERPNIQGEKKNA